MKKFKRLSALLLAVIMTVAMIVPAMADIAATTNAPTTDKAPISVSGLNAGDEVTFYQVMKVTYNSDKQVEDEKEWKVATNLSADLAEKLRKGEAATEADINALASAIKDGTITPLGSATVPATNGVATLPNMNAGTYIAVVTNTAKVPAVKYTYDNDGKITETKYIKKDWTETTTAPTDATKDEYRYVTPIYNPIMLSAGYNENKQFATEGKDIAVGSKYGNTGKAKSSTPTVAKEITGGVTPDASDANDKTDQYDEDEFSKDKANGKKTASLGETINYEVRVNVPQYPAGAVNKSLWMKDTFDKGINFLGLETVDVAGGFKADLTATAEVKKEGVGTGYYPLVKEGKTIGWVKQTAKKTSATTNDAIEIIFDYDVVDELGLTQIPVKYNGCLNEDAEIGHVPNKNKVEYFYTTNPNQGDSYKPGDTEPTDDIAKEEDEEVVYTYKVAIVKTDTAGNRLPGAVFVVKDSSGKYYNSVTKKFDITASAEDLASQAAAEAKDIATFVSDQTDGIVEFSGLVKMGDYTFEEIVAPADYVLPSVHPTVKVTANWVNCQKSKSEKEWTTVIEDAMDYDETKTPKAAADGYILNGRHLTDEEYAALSAEDKEAAQVAYVRLVKKYFYNVENPEETSAAGYNYGTLMNSKTPELPSTGGMGTYIFTIVGVAILAVAAFMLIAKKRKAQ